MIEGILRQARNRVRSILDVCEEFDVRRSRAKRVNQNDFHFLSKVVKCGASQKKGLRDSTRGTARRSLLLGMCRRLRLITRNFNFSLA